MTNTRFIALFTIAAALVAACSKEEVVESPQFDAKVIAAEADSGNLGPLKELNAACTTEVEKSGKRGAACTTQDEVGALRKPLKLKF
jgi:hypothetical protein